MTNTMWVGLWISILLGYSVSYGMGYQDGSVGMVGGCIEFTN